MSLRNNQLEVHDFRKNLPIISEEIQERVFIFMLDGDE
jgi:hypothetical protein